MAVTVTEGIISPYDATTNLRQNIADMIDAIDRREVPLLNILGWSMEAGASKGADSLKFPCIQPQHTWQSDSLIPNIADINAAYTSGNVTITLKSGQAKYFVVDEVIVATSGANTTHWRIISVDTTNDILGVTNLNNDQNHAVGVQIYSMGRPAIRGEQFATAGRVTTITNDTNFTEIFGGGTEGVVSLSGTEQATESFGLSNRLEYETAKKLAELVIRMEQAAAYGFRSGALPTSNDQPASRMGGLWFYIASGATGASPAGHTSNASGGALTSNEGLLKQLIDDVWSDGGKPSLLFMGAFQRRGMSDLLAPFVRTPRDERVMGVVTDIYEYSHGQLNVGLSKWIHPSHLWVLSPEFLGIGPLKGNGVDRTFQVETQPKTGDYDRRVIFGEYTAEVRARQQAHGLLYNLSTS